MDKCPPHKFRAGWQDDDHGVIFCVRCGEVRAMTVQSTDAPTIEQIIPERNRGEA